MVPAIKKPTGVMRYAATAIDNMLTNSIINIEIKSDIITADILISVPILFVAKVNVDVNIKTWNVISVINPQINLSRNCVVSHGTILKYLIVSIVLIIGLSRFFFHYKNQIKTTKTYSSVDNARYKQLGIRKCSKRKLRLWKIFKN